MELIATAPLSHEPHRPDALPSRALQQLWFATQRREWSSLVVIPVEPFTSARFIAEALVQVGSLHRGIPLKLINGEGVTMASSSHLVLDMSGHVAAGGIAIGALDSIVQNQAGVPVALTADALLLGVQLGVATSAAMRRTLELVGSERVLGAVAIHSYAK